MERKKKLISFFLENDGRLSDMLTSALRPFRLIIKPPPVLSRLLRIDDLINSYNSILLNEMNGYVDMVMNQVKTMSKGEAAEVGIEYTSTLPWYPVSNAEGRFETRIPEGIFLLFASNYHIMTFLTFSCSLLLQLPVLSFRSFLKMLRKPS